LTVDKLVKHFGYPPELYNLKFDHRYMMRGLLMDKRRGNVVKIDRHKYVKVGYHGFRRLAPEERNVLYNRASVRDEFEVGGWVNGVWH
jgi:hypothetical protein